MTYSEEDIQRRLHSRNPDERRVAAIMIGKSRNYTFFDDLVTLSLHDIDKGVRAMAVFALDLLSSADAVPVFVKALYDSSFDVRSNAGTALFNLSRRYLPELILPEVIEVLKDDMHLEAKQAAYLVLSRIPHEYARNALDLYWD